MSGIRVIAVKREQPRAIVMAIPTSLSQTARSVLPPRMRGRNTITVVSVDEVTATATSRAPFNADLSRSGSVR